MRRSARSANRWRAAIIAGTPAVFAILAVAGAAFALAGCAEPPPRSTASDLYQACLARGYRIGNLPYSATTFYQHHVEDRIWAPVDSPVAQCNEYRSRGEL